MAFKNSITLFGFFLSILLWSSCGNSGSAAKETAKEVANKTTTEVKAAMGGAETDDVKEAAKKMAEASTVTEPAAKEEPKKEEVKEEKPKPKKKKKRAKMHFPEKVYDYGFIMQGDVVQHDFYFKNIGNDDLLITRVEPSCGCTVPVFPKKPIPPGEDGKISVTFKSAGKLGRQVPIINVFTNYKRKIKLELKGFVDAERAKPASVPKVIEAPTEVKQ